MSGRCVLNVWKVRFVCLEGAFCMSGRCVLYVRKVRFVCLKGAFCMSGRCVVYVWKVRLVCLEGAFCVSGRCVLYKQSKYIFLTNKAMFYIYMLCRSAVTVIWYKIVFFNCLLLTLPSPSAEMLKYKRLIH